MRITGAAGELSGNGWQGTIAAAWMSCSTSPLRDSPPSSAN